MNMPFLLAFTLFHVRLIMLLLLSLVTIVSTFLGGLFALRFKDQLHLILGFSAGAVIGVAFFDLLPEAITLSSKRYGVSAATSVVALGFIIFMIFDRSIALCGRDDEGRYRRGSLGAGSLSIHSYSDGLAMGLSFKVSKSVGIIVATAVLVHDFSDGLNTVNLILKNKGTSRRAFKWLILDAIAPALGALSTLFFTLPETALGLALAVFCGFFLYIGASDLLPESYHAHSTWWTTVATLLSIGIMYLAIRFAGA
jgi:ZIP family zinc transporter